MRIAISGTSCVGKSTLIRDFCAVWPNYTNNQYGYRDKLKESHSKQCDRDTQWMILNDMIDELQRHDATEHVIYDRCPLDNLVYTLWAHDKGQGNIDQEFVSKCIPLVRESLRHLDVIFFVPITRASPVTIIDNGTRETDPKYIEEIDNIFKALISQYQHNIERTKFFPQEDCPGIIEIFGKPQERIYLIKQYLNVNGDIIGEEGDTILNPDNLEQLESLLKQQQQAHASETFEKQQVAMLKDFVNKTKTKGRTR